MTFKTGDRVYHRGMNACGVVDHIGAIEGTVYVTYQHTKNLGTVRGVYDRRWFELHPRELVPHPESST
jgi:hypothetical protein